MNRLLIFSSIFFAIVLASISACNTSATESAVGSSDAAVPGAGQSAVKDDVSKKDVVKVAASSADHTTLVKAVQAAGLVDVLSNAGPFTVFAPTNAAFDALPPGTVESLLKPDQKTTLSDILQYHVAVGVFKPEMLRDGQTLGMVNGGNAKITVKDGKVMINDAAVVASVPASNGIVHVIDKVILPPAPVN